VGFLGLDVRIDRKSEQDPPGIAHIKAVLRLFLCAILTLCLWREVRQGLRTNIGNGSFAYCLAFRDIPQQPMLQLLRCLGAISTFLFPSLSIELLVPSSHEECYAPAHSSLSITSSFSPSPSSRVCLASRLWSHRVLFELASTNTGR
jgi:hypothetical protein